MPPDSNATRLPTLPLWLCADLASAPAHEIATRVASVLAALPACVWLRPTAATPTSTVLALTRQLARLAHAAGGLLLLGDRLDVALAAGAHGVHLGTRSATPREARALFAAVEASEPMLVSAAVHDAASVAQSAALVDALVLSPLASVPGKGPALGMGRFAALTALAPAKPFVALGGIVDAADAVDAARAGATAIAVRRALLASDEPVAACQALREAFLGARARLHT